MVSTQPSLKLPGSTDSWWLWWKVQGVGMASRRVRRPGQIGLALGRGGLRQVESAGKLY